MGTIWAEQQNKKRTYKIKITFLGHLRKQQWNSIYITGTAEKEEREKGPEKLLKKCWLKTLELRVKKAQAQGGGRGSKQMKPKGHSTRNIIIKIVKVKNKNKIVREARKEK